MRRALKALWAMRTPEGTAFCLFRVEGRGMRSSCGADGGQAEWTTSGDLGGWLRVEVRWKGTKKRGEKGSEKEKRKVGSGLRQTASSYRKEGAQRQGIECHRGKGSRSKGTRPKQFAVNLITSFFSCFTRSGCPPTIG